MDYYINDKFSGVRRIDSKWTIILIISFRCKENSQYMDYYINNKLSGVRRIVSTWTIILIISFPV